MADKTRTTCRSSELSRDSADEFAAASDYPVTVTRRDGEALVLMSEREDRARNELLQLVAHLIGVFTTSGGKLTRFMGNRFLWVLGLSPTDQDESACDVLDSVRASFSAGQSHLVLSVLSALSALSALNSWRETPEAIAAGLGQEPVDWLADDEPVERP